LCFKFYVFLKGNFMTMIHQLFLKSLATFLIALFASVAFALPTPKDIESAVSAGNYSQAESLLREVLQDKPQSAKAHYELGQVLAHEQRYKDALAELHKAKEIDPSLKFAASPEKFNEVLTKVNGLTTPSSSVVMEPSVQPGTHAASVHTNATTSTNPPATTTASGGFSLTYVWIAIAALVALGLWLRRSAPAPVAAQASAQPTAPAPARGFGAQFTPGVQPTGYGTAMPQPMNTGGSGSTMTGAVIGGLAGVAAGYALSKALEGDHHDASNAQQGNSSASVGGGSGAANGGYVPFDTPAQPDLGSFDAGSGNDWDNADSGSGSDDSW
jgi:hypothetical protein